MQMGLSLFIGSGVEFIVGVFVVALISSFRRDSESRFAVVEEHLRRGEGISLKKWDSWVWVASRSWIRKPLQTSSRGWRVVLLVCGLSLFLGILVNIVTLSR